MSHNQRLLPLLLACVLLAVDGSAETIPVRQRLPQRLEEASLEAADRFEVKPSIVDGEAVQMDDIAELPPREEPERTSERLSESMRRKMVEEEEEESSEEGEQTPEDAEEKEVADVSVQQEVKALSDEEEEEDEEEQAADLAGDDLVVQKHLRIEQGFAESMRAPGTMLEFKLGKKGTTQCEEGGTHNVTHAECEQAVKMALPPGAVQGSSTLRIDGQGAPQGCSVREGTWIAHYRAAQDDSSGSSNYYPICYHGQVSVWTPVLALSGNGSQKAMDVGETRFNQLFHSCPIVQYKRNGHVHSVYERRTPPPATFNAYKVFTQNWTSKDNMLDKDFLIYNTLQDAESSRNPWRFCVYDFPGVGYPYDCGPTNITEGKWFALPGAKYAMKGLVSGASFDIYSGTGCLFNMNSGTTPAPTATDVCSTAANETLCNSFQSLGCSWQALQQLCANSSAASTRTAQGTSQATSSTSVSTSQAALQANFSRVFESSTLMGCSRSHRLEGLPTVSAQQDATDFRLHCWQACTRLHGCRYVEIAGNQCRAFSACLPLERLHYSTHIYKHLGLAAPSQTPVWLTLNSSTATQSSTQHGGRASRAIDGKLGVKYQRYDEHSCTHTKHESDPWWSMDLGGTYSINGLRISTRADCCEGRLNPFSVSVDGVICNGNASITHLGETKFVPCKATGRTVKIALHRHHKTFLSLCEVQVAAARVAVPRLGARQSHARQNGTLSASASGTADSSVLPVLVYGNCSNQSSKGSCNAASNECEWDHSRRICYFYNLRPAPTQEMCQQQSAKEQCTKMACAWQSEKCIVSTRPQSPHDRCMAAKTQLECSMYDDCLYDATNLRCYHHKAQVAATVVHNTSSLNTSVDMSNTTARCLLFPDESSCAAAGCGWSSTKYSCGPIHVVLAKGIPTTLIGVQERPLEKADKILGTFSTAEDFEVEFDIRPQAQVHDGYASIIRFTNTSNARGDAGDEVPSFMFWPQSTRLVAIMGRVNDAEANCSIVGNLPVGQLSSVRGRLAEDTFIVYVDGVESCRVSGYTKRKYLAAPDVTVWAGDSFHKVANATISKLIYTPLTKHPAPQLINASHHGGVGFTPSGATGAESSSAANNASDAAICSAAKSHQECSSKGCAYDHAKQVCEPVPLASSVNEARVASTAPGFCLEKDVAYEPVDAPPDGCAFAADAESCQQVCASVGCFRFVYDPSTKRCCLANGGATKKEAKNKISGPASCEDLNCKWTAWSEWTACSRTCGNGTRARTRSVQRKAQPGGVDCPGVDAEQEVCSSPSVCPVDCSWSNWNDWSTCTATCGEGTQSRHRTIETQAGAGGKACIGSDAEMEPCNIYCGNTTGRGSGVDQSAICQWGDWAAWSNCTLAATGCIRTRLRELLQPASTTTTEACEPNRTQTESCHSCSVHTGNCSWSEWTFWSPCNQACGTSGVMRRTRHQLHPVDRGCGAQYQETDEKPCQGLPSCAFCPWSDWSSCSYSAGTCARARGRQPPYATDQHCESPSTETETCAFDNCSGVANDTGSSWQGEQADSASSQYSGHAHSPVEAEATTSSSAHAGRSSGGARQCVPGSLSALWMAAMLAVLSAAL